MRRVFLKSMRSNQDLYTNMIYNRKTLLSLIMVSLVFGLGLAKEPVLKYISYEMIIFSRESLPNFLVQVFHTNNINY